MPFFTVLLRLHLLVVLAFLLFYALKGALLFLGRLEALRNLRARTRIADSVLGLLILVTGGSLLAQYPGTIPGWLWTKLLLVLLLLPLAIAAMRRQHKLGVALTFLGFLYVYGLSETGSMALQSPASTLSEAPVGQAETSPTPNAAAPVDTTDMAASTGFSEADAATLTEANAAAEPAAAGLAEGKSLFQKNCAVCHGANGKLGLNGAHDLSKSNLNTAGRVYMVTQGLGKMPSFKGQLTEAQIQQVVAYSLTLK